MKHDTKDVQKPKRFDELMSKFNPDDESEGTPEGQAPPATETPAPAAEPPAAETATPATPAPGAGDPNAETTDNAKLTAELAEARSQISDLTDALDKATRALASENSDTWKHKYDVLDGIAKKQGPQIKELKAEVDRLTAELRVAVENANASAPSKETLSVKVTDIDKEFGDDNGIAPEQVAKFRQSIVRSVLDTVKEHQKPQAAAPAPTPELPVEPETATETPARTSAAQTAFLAVLDATARGWREVLDKGVREQAFSKFLASNSQEIAGEKRSFYDLLVEANGHVLDASGNIAVDAGGKPVINESKMNARRVAWFYNTFLKAEAQAAVKPPVSREAADSKSKGGGAAPKETDTWTRERLQQFNEDVSHGRIQRGSNEYKRLMASYDAWRNKVFAE